MSNPWNISVAKIIRGEPLEVVAHGRAIFILAWALIAMTWLSGTGAITAVYLMGFGASASIFRNWTRERGLWMLACVFLVPLAYCSGCWIAANVLDHFRGAKPANPATVLDVAVASLVMQANIRFLINVARHNFRISRQLKSC